MSEPRTGSETASGAAPRVLTPLEQLAECAHGRALDAAVLRDGLAGLHRQLAAEEADRTAAEIADLRARLTVTEAELERLRALPELRAGQRLRHTARRDKSPSGAPVQRGQDPLGREQSDRVDAGDGTRGPGRNTEALAPTDPAEAEPAAAPGLGYPEPALAAIVLVRNRRSALGALIDWLGRRGVERIEIVDDATSDPATLEMLDGLGRTVHRLDAPLGTLGPWALGLVAELGRREPVLVVDADTLPDTDCPDDALALLVHELDRRPGIDAVELGATPGDDQAGGDGRSIRTPLFRLVRQGASHLPSDIAVLGPPYTAHRGSLDADPEDPAERFARRADEVEGV